MRKPPRNGARAQDARAPREQPASERTAEELDPLATAPPPPLIYRDESPDAVRRDPEGRRRAMGEAKELSERISPFDVPGQARQRMLGRLREAAGSTGEMAGQLLGEAIQGSIAAEEQVRRLAARARRREESAGERIETFSTEAGHEAQERAGRIGAALAGARARLAALNERSPIELSPKAAGILAVILGLAGMGGVVLLRRMLRGREQRHEVERQAEARAEATVALPQATLPLPDGTRPEAIQVAMLEEAPPTAHGGARRRKRRRWVSDEWAVESR